MKRDLHGNGYWVTIARSEQWFPSARKASGVVERAKQLLCNGVEVKSDSSGLWIGGEWIGDFEKI